MPAFRQRSELQDSRHLIEACLCLATTAVAWCSIREQEASRIQCRPSPIASIEVRCLVCPLHSEWRFTVKRAALALVALAAATGALAQQTTPTTPAEPPTSTAPQEQTAPPADSSTRMSEADKQTLMRDCVKQVQAANPTVPQKDVEAYCDKQVKSYSSPQ